MPKAGDFSSFRFGKNENSGTYFYRYKKGAVFFKIIIDGTLFIKTLILLWFFFVTN